MPVIARATAKTPNPTTVTNAMGAALKIMAVMAAALAKMAERVKNIFAAILQIFVDSCHLGAGWSGIRSQFTTWCSLSELDNAIENLGYYVFKM
jgi:hypothetical protein